MSYNFQRSFVDHDRMEVEFRKKWKTRNMAAKKPTKLRKHLYTNLPETEMLIHFYNN